jgi:hypothetical protein
MPRGLDITDLEYLAWPPCANIQTTLCVYDQARNIVESSVSHLVVTGTFFYRLLPLRIQAQNQSSREGSPIGLGLSGGYLINESRPRESLPYQITHNLQRNAP